MLHYVTAIADMLINPTIRGSHCFWVTQGTQTAGSDDNENTGHKLQLQTTMFDHTEHPAPL